VSTPDRAPRGIQSECWDFGRIEGGKMRKKRHTPDQIIAKLREAEVALSQGKIVPEAFRNLGVTKQTYYCCRKEFGGLKVN